MVTDEREYCAVWDPRCGSRRRIVGSTPAGPGCGSCWRAWGLAIAPPGLPRSQPSETILRRRPSARPRASPRVCPPRRSRPGRARLIRARGPGSRRRAPFRAPLTVTIPPRPLPVAAGGEPSDLAAGGAGGKGWPAPPPREGFWTAYPPRHDGRDEHASRFDGASRAQGEFNENPEDDDGEPSRCGGRRRRWRNAAARRRDPCGGGFLCPGQLHQHLGGQEFLAPPRGRASRSTAATGALPCKMAPSSTRERPSASSARGTNSARHAGASSGGKERFGPQPGSSAPPP